VLLHFYTAKPQQKLKHIYCGSSEAASGSMTVKVTARGAERLGNRDTRGSTAAMSPRSLTRNPASSRSPIEKASSSQALY